LRSRQWSFGLCVNYVTTAGCFSWKATSSELSSR
jgi:hypothetical protein